MVFLGIVGPYQIWFPWRSLFGTSTDHLTTWFGKRWLCPCPSVWQSSTPVTWLDDGFISKDEQIILKTAYTNIVAMESLKGGFLLGRLCSIRWCCWCLWSELRLWPLILAGWRWRGTLEAACPTWKVKPHLHQDFKLHLSTYYLFSFKFNDNLL